MATAADYRKWAEECFEWARQASDESVREQYASLGRVWLDCAARAERRSGTHALRTENSAESSLATQPKAARWHHPPKSVFSIQASFRLHL